jgi:hypothetical protein
LVAEFSKSTVAPKLVERLDRAVKVIFKQPKQKEVRMEKFQPVIDWFTDRGGKYAGDSAPSLYQDADTKFWEEIEHTGNHEIKYRGLQLFVTEVSLGSEKSIISLQYLLDHSRQDEDDNEAINTAIELLEPLLPEKAEFDLSCSIGTDIFLIRDLEDDDL